MMIFRMSDATASFSFGSSMCNSYCIHIRKHRPRRTRTPDRDARSIVFVDVLNASIGDFTDGARRDRDRLDKVDGLTSGYSGNEMGVGFFFERF